MAGGIRRSIQDRREGFPTGDGGQTSSAGGWKDPGWNQGCFLGVVFGGNPGISAGCLVRSGWRQGIGTSQRDAALDSCPWCALSHASGIAPCCLCRWFFSALVISTVACTVVPAVIPAPTHTDTTSSNSDSTPSTHPTSYLGRGRNPALLHSHRKCLVHTERWDGSSQGSAVLPDGDERTDRAGTEGGTERRDEEEEEVLSLESLMSLEVA